MIQDMFEDMPILTSIIGLVLLFLVLVAVDGIFSKKVLFSGTICDKHYKAESTSTGVGTGITSNGTVGTIVTTNTEDEEFLIMVKDKNGKIFTTECGAELYYSKIMGQKMDCYWTKGLISGSQWSAYGIK